jgi:hypothetical protein
MAEAPELAPIHGTPRSEEILRDVGAVMVDAVGGIGDRGAALPGLRPGNALAAECCAARNRYRTACAGVVCLWLLLGMLLSHVRLGRGSITESRYRSLAQAEASR